MIGETRREAETREEREIAAGERRYADEVLRDGSALTDYEGADGRRLTEDEFLAAMTPDPSACDGCGCVPGDGRTEGCQDPDGCGYFEERARS